MKIAEKFNRRGGKIIDAVYGIDTYPSAVQPIRVRLFERDGEGRILQAFMSPDEALSFAASLIESVRMHRL